MKQGWLLIFISLFMGTKAYATHNRSGEITYKHVSGLTYDFTITTYTKTSSVDADRSELQIFWGDGKSDTLQRTLEVDLPNDIRHNQYTGRHTYSGPFRYIVYMIDPNRIESILNIPNSVQVPFSLEDTLNILDPTVFGFNSSPVLLNPPIDFGNVGQIFVHNPNAYDPDGDSLSYKIVPPRQDALSEVPGYVSPDQIAPGPNNKLTINAHTGELRWNAPQRPGIYNIAILITEYRYGQMIGTVVRDLQIIIQSNENAPPAIQGKDEICVVAGDTIDEKYIATDANSGDNITFSSNGFPYLVPTQKAAFTTLISGNPASARFYWETSLSHLRNTPYQIVVKAEDNKQPPLVDIKTVVIKILAPAPTGFTALFNPSSKVVNLTWDNNYPLKNLDKFLGFSIWRRQGCGYQVDTCSSNLQALGYTKIGETTSNQWVDSDLEHGVDYSYVVVAEFASKSQIGLIFNRFKGITTNESCVRLPIDVPVLYHVDVRKTDSLHGEIFIDWTKPLAESLDTLINPGPYQVRLYRVEDTGRVLLKETMAMHYMSDWDTTYLDTLINTEGKSYRYELDFFVSGDEFLGKSPAATSIFLNIIPTDKTLNLRWDEETPWRNELYYIYEMNNLGNFILIDSTINQNYRLDSLSNDSTYCFKIEGKGTYDRPELKYPLLNFSQIVCSRPRNTIPPCTPILKVENRCTNETLGEELPDNYLSWNFGRTCTDSSSVAEFYIYYKKEMEDDYQLIISVKGKDVRAYSHQPAITNSGGHSHEEGEDEEHHHDTPEIFLQGCYKIAAVDTLGNISDFSNEVCVSDCPLYQLPNAFTPNGDGINDLYTPILPYSGVTRIELKIYNRMGNLVYETTSPDINWNGQDQKTGKEMPTGVFYYVCEVYFDTLTGEQKLEKPLSGYIHLIREK